MTNDHDSGQSVIDFKNESYKLTLAPCEGEIDLPSLRQEVEDRLFYLLEQLSLKKTFWNRTNKKELKKMKYSMDLISEEYYSRYKFFFDKVFQDDQKKSLQFLEGINKTRSLIEFLIHKKEKSGNKSLVPPLAYVLYSYLKRFEKNRPALDAIGKTIGFSGSLEKRYDEYRSFVKEDFDIDLVEYNEFKFPAVLNTEHDRWERGVKGNYKSQALIYYKSNKFIKENKFSPAAIESGFDKAMLRGGFVFSDSLHIVVSKDIEAYLKGFDQIQDRIESV